MPYTRPQQTRRQRHRRRAGQVKRVELVLNAESEQDRTIYDHLAALPRGEVSEFIKTAILEKIARSTAPKPEPPDPSRQIVAMLSEIDRKISAGIVPSAGDVMAAPVASAGLDMSAPRRRNGAAPARPAPAPIAELTEDQRSELARQLVASVKGFKGNTSAPGIPGR